MNTFATRDSLVSEILQQVEKAPEKSQKFGRFECTLATEVSDELRADLCRVLQKGPWRVFGQGNYFRLLKKDPTETGSSF